MKTKTSYFVIASLIVIIISLLGYNEMTKRKEKKRLEALNTSTQVSSNQNNAPKVDKVYCIGDSFTLGDETSSYPKMLSDLIDMDTTVFGATYDQSLDISIRMGSTPIYAYDITIPSDTTAVNLSLFDENGNTLNALRSESTNFKEVEIAGIKGVLTFNPTEEIHSFTRSEAGEETYLSELTQITSKVDTFNKNSIAIIYTGIYDDNIQDDVQSTIAYQKQIIDKIGTDKYLVIGLTSKRTFEYVDDVNAVLKDAYGDHFLDFRSYLLENGLDDANIEPTDEDLDDIDNGYIPSSLLQDNLINGNAEFNELLAKCIYSKLSELNYIES